MSHNADSNPEAEKRAELLEIYRLHAELADRVSQRREGANRLYVSVQLALVVLLAAIVRFGTGDVPQWVVLTAIGIIGSSLSISWQTVIRSYRQLNSGKLKTLHELEDQLSFPFFKREWDILGKGEDRAKYRKLTRVESLLPFIFLALFLLIVATALIGLIGDLQSAERVLGEACD